MNWLEVALCLALGFVLYSYVLFPVILFTLSSFKQGVADSQYLFARRERRMSNESMVEAAQSVAIVFSAYNEEKHIIARIQNLLSLDSEERRLVIYVGNDGSTDSTAELLAGISDDRLRFFDFECNRGKATVLNDLMAEVKEPLVVFTDANTEFDVAAIREVTRHFVSPEIGVVSGELQLIDSESADNLDGVYWKYERFLKFHESRIDGMLGANGALYALRRELWRPIASDTIVDDFTIVLNVSLQGYRVIYEPNAIARESVAPDVEGEFRRRVRIGAGNYQALSRFPELLLPHYGVRCFTYLSHKVIRWFTPHLLVIALALTAVLAFHSLFYLSLLMLQLFAYAGSLYYLRRPVDHGLARLPIFWINMNIALLVGFVKFARGGMSGAWKSTER